MFRCPLVILFYSHHIFLVETWLRISWFFFFPFFFFSFSHSYTWYNLKAPVNCLGLGLCDFRFLVCKHKTMQMFLYLGAHNSAFRKQLYLSEGKPGKNLRSRSMLCPKIQKIKHPSLQLKFGLFLTICVLFFSNLLNHHRMGLVFFCSIFFFLQQFCLQAHSWLDFNTLFSLWTVKLWNKLFLTARFAD